MVATDAISTSCSKHTGCCPIPARKCFSRRRKRENGCGTGGILSSRGRTRERGVRVALGRKRLSGWKTANFADVNGLEQARLGRMDGKVKRWTKLPRQRPDRRGAVTFDALIHRRGVAPCYACRSSSVVFCAISLAWLQVHTKCGEGCPIRSKVH